MTGVLFRFCGTMLAIPLAAWLLPGVHVSGMETAWVAGVLLAMLFLVLRPLAKLLLVPFNCLTFGILGLLLDVGLVALAARWMPGLYIDGFLWTLVTAAIVWIAREGLGRLGGATT